MVPALAMSRLTFSSRFTNHAVMRRLNGFLTNISTVAATDPTPTAFKLPTAVEWTLSTDRFATAVAH